MPSTQKRPKTIKGKYRKGADFERKALKYLLGGGKHTWDIGWIETQCIHLFGEDAWRDMREYITIAGTRTPGSKGKGGNDLLIALTRYVTKNKNNIMHQTLIGVQCKSSKERSDDKIEKAMDIMKKGFGVHPMWVYGLRGKVIIHQEDKWIQFLERLRPLWVL